jgi:hypothetical protein
MLATPAVARERHVTSRHLAEDANASITPGALAEVTGFAAITLAAVVLQVAVIAVTVTAPAVCMADRSDTGAAMCGAARAPTMGPWFRRRLELGPSPPLRSRRLAPFDSVGSCWRPASPPFAVILRDTLYIACAHAMHGSAGTKRTLGKLRRWRLGQIDGQVKRSRP